MSEKYNTKISNFIKENYPTKGARWCAEQLGPEYTKIMIFKFCLRNKIKKDRPYEGKNFDIEIFKNIELPEMAYFLGLIWADGHVAKNGYQVTMSVQKEDGLIFYEVFKKLGHFSTWISEKEFKKDTFNLSLNSKEITLYLASMGYRDKSLIDPSLILSTIPDHLKRYFWLGFLDGDGCWMVDKSKSLNFCGSYSQDWTSLIEFINSYSIPCYVQRTATNCGKRSSVSVLSQFDMVKLGDILYQDYEINNIGLPRKFNKFLKLKNKLCSGYDGKNYLGVNEYINRGEINYFFKFSCRGVNYSKYGFKTKEGAAVAYDLKVIELYGHKKLINFPSSNYSLELNSFKSTDPIQNIFVEYDHTTPQV